MVYNSDKTDAVGDSFLLSNLGIKKMQKLKLFWTWLVKSSVDANSTSLTVKAFLYGLIPVAVSIANVAHWQVGSAQLTNVVDLIGQFITVVGGAIAALACAGGLIRKIFNTITGENEVLNSQ